MKKIAFLFILAFGIFACQSDVKTESGTTTSTTTEAQADDVQYFGAKITADNAISYEDMLTKMGSSDSLAVKVSAQIGDVCQKKGCWMTVVDKEGQEMLVQFEDYGFFMPKDAANKHVVIDGYAYREVTPVKMLKHIASDAGEPQEVIDAITEPEEELKFMAKGVILKD